MTRASLIEDVCAPAKTAYNPLLNSHICPSHPAGGAGQIRGGRGVVLRVPEALAAGCLVHGRARAGVGVRAHFELSRLVAGAAE